MLIAIRERAKGWFAWLLILALVIPLAFFGVYSYVQDAPPSEVAVVNDTKITSDQVSNAVQAQRRRLEQMFGGQLDPALFDEKQMRREAVDRLIDEALLSDYVQRQGFRVSNSALASAIFSEEAFQANGKFSSEVYQTVLRNNGLSPQIYESRMRHGKAMEQLQSGIISSDFVTDQAVQRLIALERQERNLAYLKVSASKFRDRVTVSDAEVESFYQQNAQMFQLPEKVKLAYLELNRDALAQQVSIPDEELRSRYEELKESRFTKGGERRIRHILLQLPAGATADQEAEARQKLEGVREQIEAGKLAFEAAAKEHSDDPGSAQGGGDLGMVSRGVMVEEFERAAFALEKGKLSEPVRTPFGLHLIQVTEIAPLQVQTFEEVRNELREEMVAERLDNRIVELGNRLADLAYEHPQSLEPAAEQLGLQPKQTDWIARGGKGAGIAANPKVLEAAFSDSVLRERHNSGVIALEDGRQLIVRVEAHEPAEQKPLNEVAGQIREQLVQQKAAASAQELGAKLQEQLAAGEAPEKLASSNGVELAQPGFVGRGADAVPQPVLREAFELPTPKEGGSSVGGVQLPNGDFAALKVSEVREAPADGNVEQLRESAEQQLQALYGNTAVKGLREVLREGADIEIREDRL